jgi:hypothetical protein
MLGLTDEELTAGPILDCPGGAGDFGARVRALGGEVVSVDPAYAEPRDALIARARAEVLRANRYVADNPHLYRFGIVRSVEHHLETRSAACETFAADFAADGRRYLVASLPSLPFRDRRFALALTSYLLFSYPDLLDLDFHVASLVELARVAEEVRAFPLLDTAGVAYPRLDEVRARLAAAGVETEVRRVDFEFQRGGDRLLAGRSLG